MSSNGSIFRVIGLLWGEPPVTGGFPSQRPVTRGFDAFFICACTSSCTIETSGDMRRHHAHYDVLVMALVYLNSTAIILANFLLLHRQRNKHEGCWSLDYTNQLINDIFSATKQRTATLCIYKNLDQLQWHTTHCSIPMQLRKQIIVQDTWRRHQIEAFSAVLAFVRGLHRRSVDPPHKGQWRGALMFSLIIAWTNGWENGRAAGDFRRHRSHYDVILMLIYVTNT